MKSSRPVAVDLLIEARWVVPVEPHAVVLEDHAVAVRDSKIVDILPQSEARARYEPAEHVQLGEHALIPGLVNSHTHNPMTLLRGLADDLPLMEWLQGHIWPAEAKFMGPEFVRDGTELAIAEMLRGGTTCANENYFFPDAIGETYRKHGFRAVLGLPVINFPTGWAATDDEYFERALEVHERFRGDALVSTAFVPHAPYTVSDASFERIRLLAEQLDIKIHLHTHETVHEVNEEVAKSGRRPFQRLQELGLVNERLIAVHMTELTDAEIEACAAAGVSVVHCPESNLKLASGFCPAEKLRKAGVNVAIGTDGAASNNDLDMFGETRTAALLAKAVSGDAAAFDAAYALRAATLNGALALGLEDRIGSIEVGKQADLAAVRLSDLETQPLFHVASQLVYATGRHQVTDVWIAGQRKLRERVLTGMDEAALVVMARRWRERIAAG
ncbi:TRZ/ATZ family hydrolase [Frateuria aurantia]|uniref:Cytosine deaminase-like metal-dependent hydrolase n=1 Tax=Frateuria aurantia (strain ATCC 33424 / DSM 6220 / KCTC 2777 / LMG 1558 / NBRC 3245 / NCIMB 13370) TaxID=767434 RepID=H8KYT8_FRAAD|nr:TRZ/ATZ family hydrolase [Frateuria aurantia]AFC86159.1 cytosine deaminase-like metal-dependent hydrolase [Frateuria aurantia DSM 6220]